MTPYLSLIVCSLSALFASYHFGGLQAKMGQPIRNNEHLKIDRRYFRLDLTYLLSFPWRHALTYHLSLQALTPSKKRNPQREKTYLWHMHLTKTRTVLRIRAVWLASSLSAWRNFAFLAIQKAPSEYWSECENAQADLRLAHISKGTFSNVASQRVKTGLDIHAACGDK